MENFSRIQMEQVFLRRLVAVVGESSPELEPSERAPLARDIIGDIVQRYA